MCSPTLDRRKLVIGFAAGTIVPIVGGLSGCETNPETGRSQLLLVSDGQLAQLSSQAWKETLEKEKISTNSRYNNQLNRVGRKIANASGRGSQNWEFKVFDNDEKNAFVLPGGKVGFYSGLMDLAESDDQLATVLGHEVAHITARHSAERVSQNIAAQGGVMLGQIALGQSEMSPRRKQQIFGALGLGLQFGILLPFSRKHELEADLLGVDYMYRAGYDTRQSVSFWQKMAAANSGPRPPEFMSTHPGPDTRIRRLRDHINSRGYASM